jgi:hypothetical protein
MKFKMLFSGLFDYQIIDFHYKYDIDEIEETYIDLTFERNGKIVIIRFLSPVDIRLNGAFEQQQGGGFEILDIKKRQMENIGVEVRNFEPSEGNFTFYARIAEKIFEGSKSDLQQIDP